MLIYGVVSASRGGPHSGCSRSRETTGSRRCISNRPASRSRQARFSPDGRFVAYTSNASGRSEVYVQPFPVAAGGKWQVSQGGGAQPRWRRDGKELFYISPDSTTHGGPGGDRSGDHPGLHRGGAQGALCGDRFGAAGRVTNFTRYDVTADGQKFLNQFGPDGHDGGAAGTDHGGAELDGGPRGGLSQVVTRRSPTAPPRGSSPLPPFAGCRGQPHTDCRREISAGRVRPRAVPRIPCQPACGGSSPMATRRHRG